MRATEGTSKPKLGSKAAHVHKQNEGSVHTQAHVHPEGLAADKAE